MSLTQFLSILVARWKWVLGAFAGIVALTVLGSLIWPKSYTATAVVVVDSKPDPVSALLYSGTTTPGFMATQVEIVQSDRVAQRVVRNLRLGESVQTRIEWQEDTKGTGSIEAWLAERLTKKLDVKPSRESNLITVNYKADSPQQAAFMANAFVQAYLDTNLDLRTDPAKQYSSFFDSRSKQLREELEAAQAKLSAFQREKGILATDERLDIENARLNDLSTQLVTLQALAAESSSRQTQARRSAGELTDVLANPLIASLKADLSRAQAKLKELTATLGDNHPAVVQQRASINELRSRIDAETGRIGSGVGVTATINTARVAEVQAAFDAQRQKVLQMKALRDEAAVMQKDVENAQRAYDAVLARLNQSSLESENKLPNVAILTPATEPLKPSSPNLLINTVLAVLLGLPIAIGIALLIEHRDRRVRTLDDLTRTLTLPVIGHLQIHARQRRLFGRQRLPALSQSLMRSLPGAAAK
ncbi:MAG: chain length determinant protein EpsF [Pseudomonadota bacterium]